MTTTLLQLKVLGEDKVLVNSTEYKSVGHALNARVAKRRKNDGFIWEIWSDKSMDMNNPDIEYQCVDSTEWYN